MKQTAEKLRQILNLVTPLMRNISDSAAAEKPAPDKWSQKEILGHLIDSAGNNHQKFVRTMAQNHFDFVGYEQNHWVESQNYAGANWGDLVGLWLIYNLHLAHIIENVPHKLLSNTISIDGSGPFTLEFIMNDYGEHLKHHLKQIIPDAGLESNFENVYNV